VQKKTRPKGHGCGANRSGVAAALAAALVAAAPALADPIEDFYRGKQLTIVIRGNIQVLKVLGPGARRGPPAEARQLYEMLSPPVGKAPAQPDASGERARGAGRPSKRERRQIDRFTEQE